MKRALTLFLLTFGAYAYFYQGGGWNQNARFALTRSIVERGKLDIDPFQSKTGDTAVRDGHYYCEKAPGVSVLAVPAYALQRALGEPRPDDAAYTATLFAVALPSALAVVALADLLGLLGLSAAPAHAIAVAYGLGTLAFPYSTMLYGHQLSADLGLVAFWLLVRGNKQDAHTPLSLFTAGALLGTQFAVEYPSVLTSVPVAAYAFLTVRTRMPLFLLGALIPFALLTAYHSAVFGDPLALPYLFSRHPNRAQDNVGFRAAHPLVLFHILISPYRGLFFSAPWLLLPLLGLLGLVRDRLRRAEGLTCIAVFGAYLLLNISMRDWDGDWTFGPRHVVAGIPFLAVGAAGLPWRRRATWLAFVPLALLSFAMMLVGTSVRPEAPDQLPNPFRQLLIPAFVQGRLSLNAQSIDEAWPGPTPVAWNLGQRVGLEGTLSVAPLLAWLALLGMILSRQTREGGSTRGSDGSGAGHEGAPRAQPY